MKQMRYPNYQYTNKLQIEDTRKSKLPIDIRQRIVYTSSIPAFHRQQSGQYQQYVSLLRNTVTRKKCEMCQNVANQLIPLAKCSHSFCQRCLTQYVSYKVSVCEQISCPQEDCKQFMNENCQFFQDLPQKIKDKYAQNKLWKQTMNNPNYRLCPRQNCKGGLVNLLLKPPKCQKCGITFCKQCQLQAHEGSCQKVFQQMFGQFKRCPKCKVFIERTQGCNHMVCRCNYQFCFICLASWENDHYACTQQVITFGCVPENEIIKKLYLALGIIFFPIYLFLCIFSCVFLFALCLAVAAVFSPCIALSVLCPYCGQFSFVFLPFGMIIAIIGIPIAILVTYLYPVLINQSIRRYFAWINRLI